jgi:hypothetical protein
MPKSSLYPNIATIYPALSDVPTDAEFLIAVDGRNLNATPAQMAQIIGVTGEGVDLSDYATIEYVDAQIDALEEVTYALPLDPENAPVEGDLLVLGPDLTVGRADIIDGIAANDPENGSLTYANPLVIDLGSAPDQTSYQVSLTGTLVLAEVIGAAEALRAGVTCDLLVTQAGAGTYDLTGVPTGWVNIQPEQPALATGVGAVSYVVFKIIDPDAADQVVHFTVAPGANV